MPMRSLRGDYLANVKLNPQLSVNGFTVSDRRLEREEGDNSEGCVKRGVTPPVLGDLGHLSLGVELDHDRHRGVPRVPADRASPTPSE